MANYHFNKTYRGITFLVMESDGGYVASVRGRGVSIGPFRRKWFADKSPAMEMIQKAWDEHQAVA